MSVLDLHFRQQVEELFDTYAPNFEEELAALGYDVPAIVEAELLAERAPAENLSRTLAVDLGCGTGWAGARLRPHCAGRLIGCDLSKGILREARAKGVFDALEQMDAVAFLHRREANSADLIVATDVLVYMRGLEDLMREAARALAPAGLFAFSTENATLAETGGLPPAGAGWIERPSERIAHAPEYLEWAVKRAGLRVARVRDCMVRRDGKAGEIHGKVFIAVKPTDAEAAAATKEAATAAPAPAAGSEPDAPQATRALLYQIVETPRLPSNLLDAAFWEECACGGLTVGRSQAAGGLASAASAVDAARASLGASGHARLPALEWERLLGVPLSAMASTVDALQARGFPPVFLLMYDQPWALCAQLVSEAAAVMQAEVELDPSVFVWSLSRAAADGAADAVRRVGDNFGKPHRDCSFDKCHRKSDGRMASLSVWVPLAEVAADSGCMCVVPREHDALYAESDHPQHLQPAACVDADGRRVTDVHAHRLPAAAGDVLMWRPSTIHWGTPCAHDAALPPRKSLALEVARADAEEGGGGGLGEAALRSMSVKKRVRLIAQSLLTYEHWHPEFEGFAPARVSECAGAMAFPEARGFG